MKLYTRTMPVYGKFACRKKLDASSAVEVEKDGYILKFELDGSLSSTDSIEAPDTENSIEQSTETADTPQSDSAATAGSTVSPLPDGTEVVQVNEFSFCNVSN